MFKKLFFMVLVLLLTVTLFACGRDKDEEPKDETPVQETNTLFVHYFRFDGNYDAWSLWIWPHEPSSLGGTQYFFEDESEFGVLFKMPLEGAPFENSTRAGIIVRGVNDWSKDVDSDRFFSLTEPDEHGNIHIYLIENTFDIYYSLEDAAIVNQVNLAQFDDETTIRFNTTLDINASDVTIYKNDSPVSTKNFNFGQLSGTIELNEPVNLTDIYEIEVRFSDEEIVRRRIRFDGFYNSDAFNEAFGYEGELGAIYTEAKTTFRLWAPISESVTLNLYTKGHRSTQTDYQGQAGVDTPYETHSLTRIEKGAWEVIVDGDLDGIYYTFTIVNDGVSHEVVDPYAFSAGVNGQRGMVVNFSRTNPTGWVYGDRPNNITYHTDAIIYEVHVRDFTSHSSWNGTEEYRGKFLGFSETGTTFKGVKTGFDHIVELGVTHVQFIPIYDHGIIDETRLNDPSYYGIHDGIFNWGYMPEHFNVVEGSYSTDPYNGHVRITELKTMIKTFHDHDIRVIMDVVYNHTGRSADSNFDLILPGYYFRMNEDGSFSNGSGTGNETASERFMFRRFMIDSVLFWAQEYNISGFRFDLMKLHDYETMNLIREALDEIDPSIIILGEPWTGGGTPLADRDAAYNVNLDKMPNIAVFNDDTRDAIKGSVFEARGIGFVQGNNQQDHHILLGIVGATPQPNLPITPLAKGAWAIEPNQTINYVTAHDNNTLYDKLRLSTSGHTLESHIRMQRQSNAIVLTSQGIPFLHAGVEIMRTKPCVVPTSGENTCDANARFDHNSYRSPDEVNQIDWQWKVDHYETFEYYRDLIALRRMKDVFRLPTSDDIFQQLQIIPNTTGGFISYLLHDEDDFWKTTYVIFNNGNREREITLLEGTTWHLVATTDEIGDFTTVTINGDTFDTLTVLSTHQGGTTITLPRNQTLILYSEESVRLP